MALVFRLEIRKEGVGFGWESRGDKYRQNDFYENKIVNTLNT